MWEVAGSSFRVLYALALPGPDAIDQVAGWYHHTDYERAPFVTHFDCLAHLLALVLQPGLNAATRTNLAAWNRERTRDANRFFRGAVEFLVSA